VADRDILTEALALPIDERARIVHELLRSLEAEEPESDPTELERAWTEEISHRLDELDAGTAATDDWPTVRDELRAQLARRRVTR